MTFLIGLLIIMPKLNKNIITRLYFINYYLPQSFINGLRDKLFPVKGVESAFSTMQDVWKSQSVENLLTTKFYDLPIFAVRRYRMIYLSSLIKI